jgi:hypothetical protein
MSDTVGDETGPATAAAAPGPETKSEGQLLLERLLAQGIRLNRIRKRLEEVRGSIAPSAGVGALPSKAQQPEVPATSFFAGLGLVAAFNELVTDELERTVDDLAKLF